MIFFTSDLHLGHANIIRLCNRPFSNVEEMDETIINNWNSVVTDNDDVYILGDFSYKSENPISYLKKLNLPHKVVPVGRLDKESEGLMILTNDGNFINELNDHSNNYTKDYLVTLKEKITPNFLENVKEPFIIKDKKTLPIIIKQLDDYRALFTLQDGKYHQIRRAVIRSNNTVVLLKRVRIGPYLWAHSWF